MFIVHSSVIYSCRGMGATAVPINRWVDKEEGGVCAWYVCVCIYMLLFCSVTKFCFNSFVTPWTVALQAPLSFGFPGKNIGLGWHFPLQGIFPIQGLNLHVMPWQEDSLSLSLCIGPKNTCDDTNLHSISRLFLGNLQMSFPNQNFRM